MCLRRLDWWAVSCPVAFAVVVMSYSDELLVFSVGWEVGDQYRGMDIRYSGREVAVALVVVELWL